MKSPRNSAKTLLIVAAVVEIVVGLAHFGMPAFALKSPGIAASAEIESDFLTLLLLCVGILLIAFGACTLLLLRESVAIQILFYYTVIKSVLWLARVIIEVVYPVEVPLFHLEQPTLYILPMLVLEWLLFVAAAFLTAKQLRSAPRREA